MKKTIAIILTGILMCACLCACSQGTDATKAMKVSSSSSSEMPTVASSSNNYVGKQQLLEMTNATGYEIVSMTVLNSDNDAEVELLKKGETLKNWETKEFVYSMDAESVSSVDENVKPAEPSTEMATEGATEGSTEGATEGATERTTESATTSTENTTIAITAGIEETTADLSNVTGMNVAPEAKLLPTEYSIVVLLDNGESFTLHAFPMEDAVKMIIVYGDGYGYLIYESLVNESMINTSETEKALAETQTYIDNSYNYNYGYDYNYGYQDPVYQEPVYQAPAYQEPTTQGGSEGCLDGGLFW